MKNISSYGPVLLRVAMSLVFLWFSTNQFMHPSVWVGVVPVWAASLVGGTQTVVFLNAWFELIAGLMLLIGFHTRIVALLLGLHLIGIAGGFGLSAIGVRDWGLCLATLSIFFNGVDMWCFDRRFHRDFEAIDPRGNVAA
jgi:uncharacterized membrane protein YphA (DoxX/SURF4 family)